MEWFDAVGTAELLRAGEVRGDEVIVEARRRMERLNPELNAVICELEAAPASSGPLAGVPFLMKDLGAVLAGHPRWQGNRALRDIGWRATQDSPLAVRFRDAGLVTLGKTNVPEFGTQPTTQPLAFGPTRNPWDVRRSAGGSSGGSAAAVASGMVSMAHAGDGGGSTRIPAAFCGLVGLKPSRGRVVAEAYDITRQATELVLSRTVRDTALALAIAQGTTPGALFLAPPVAGPYEGPIGVMRIGVLVESPAGPVHPECALAAERAAPALEAMGHRVEYAHPAALFEQGNDADRVALFRTTGLSAMRGLSALLGRPAGEDDVEPYTWANANHPQLPDVGEYMASQLWQQAWSVRMDRWWSEDGFDVLLTPTVPEPAPFLETLAPDAARPWKIAPRFRELSAFVNPWNVTGHPAISLPLHWTPEGLPVGVQLVGAFGREDVLLRLSAALENGLPWAHRWPVGSS